MYIFLLGLTEGDHAVKDPRQYLPKRRASLLLIKHVSAFKLVLHPPNCSVLGKRLIPPRIGFIQ